MRVFINIFALVISVSASSLLFAQTEPLNANKKVGKLWEQPVESNDKSGMVEGNAVLVFDGDTIGIVAKDGSRLTIKLRGIDAPEMRQPFGLEAAKQLAYMVQGMNVTAIIGDKDSSGRYYTGAVFLDGEDVSLAQLKKGLAWSYLKAGARLSREQRDVFVRTEQQAKNDKTGLWSGSDPIAPWVFRGEIDGQSAEIRPPITNATVTQASQQSVKETSSGTVVKPVEGSVPKTTVERKYILGPRGGCYYVTEKGSKIYVSNKELCTKQ